MQMGEGSDYTDNTPLQCLHPVGHWYEIPNLLRNGVLARLLDERPQLRYLMVHNIDTLGANMDPAMLGCHIGAARPGRPRSSGGASTTAAAGWRADGHVRLIEGLALAARRSSSRFPITTPMLPGWRSTGCWPCSA